MAATVQIGGNGTLFIGEDKLLRIEVVNEAGVPVDASGWTIVFDVRKSDTATVPLLLKTATVTGTFNPVRASNTQRAEVLLTSTEMDAFKQKTYRHSWKRTNAGNETIIARGNFKPEKATAA